MNELSTIKGVGPKTLKALNILGINTADDLINYYPYKYNFLSVSNIKEVADKTNVIVEGIVESEPILRRFGKMNSLTFRMNINSRLINVVVFNRAFLRDKIDVGSFLTLFGRYEIEKNNFVCSDIRFGRIKNNSIESLYHLTSGIKEKALKKYIIEALEYKDETIDYIPEYLKKEYKFISKEKAIEKIHYPRNLKDIKDARMRLIYEELFVFMFKINYFKFLNRKEKKETIRDIDKKIVDDFILGLPFELTKDQLKAVDNIFEDLTGENRMNRLIQGDVGSGKTIVSVIAGFINCKSGYQTALMVPTEILAAQHYNSIKKLLRGTSLRVAYLVGSMKAKEKKEIQEKLNNGKIDFIIGTHALISNNAEFKNLGLVITDEQHRFGVNQRSNFRNKGHLADTLYMSATPIPRTYALTLYGDMDISNIKTKPSGRKEIKTILKNEEKLKDVLHLMLEEVKKGRQIYVVSPLIEESETMELTNVNELKKKLDEAFNKKVKTDILHGKLKKEEKDKVMNDFVEGKTSVLISTTVIEVGVDVKNATMIAIFDAVRFGLSTLHQLRGRIGRNEYESTCVLIGDEKNKRLKVLCESNDGFFITEQDYLQRGEGDLFGIKQSGDMTFKLANLKKDLKILLKAKDDSNEFLKNNIKSDFIDFPEYNNIVNENKNLD